ncbi:hypothetical protein Landi51_00561 [Colletotrichum acutatum]
MKAAFPGSRWLAFSPHGTGGGGIRMVRRRRQRCGGETNRKRPAQSGPISSAASARICKGHQKQPSQPAPGNMKLASQQRKYGVQTPDRMNQLESRKPAVPQQGSACEESNEATWRAGMTLTIRDSPANPDLREAGGGTGGGKTGDFELDKDLEVWGTIDDIGQFYEMDSEESRADVPEGFRWSCCQRVGDVEGRHEEQHVAVLEYSPLTMGNFGEGNRAEPEVEILGERSRDKRKAEEDIIGIAQKVRTGP